MSKLILTLCALATLVLTTTGAVAQQSAFSYSGQVSAASAEFQRPNASCQTLGVAITRFNALPIQVDVTGNYQINSQQTGFDGVLLVYEESFGSFDIENTPLVGCIAGNDDFNGDESVSQINSVRLEAGTDYLIVTAGFNPNELGSFDNTISGPGRVGQIAGGLLFSGTTTNGQTFGRPVENCTPTTTSGADNVTFSALVFSVTTTGDYSFASNQDGFDGVLHIYDENFNPFSPLEGCLTGDDDGPDGIGTSSTVPIRLIADRTYFMVVSGFVDNQMGDYTNLVFGPGALFAEPGIFTLSALTGGWFDPSLDGSGFFIVGADAAIVFTYFGYINGEQRWLLSETLPSDITIGQTITARMRIGDGGQINAPIPGATLPDFGELIFRLNDCRNATAELNGEGPFNNIQQDFDLRILVQGRGRQCL